MTRRRARKTSRAPVKAFLLDQKRVAGVGNIYADEALFRARVHPLRPANRLTRAQCAAIRDAVVASLEGADHIAEWALVHQTVKEAVAAYLYNETHRRPMILPVAVEV